MSRTLAALVNLNQNGHYVHWGFIQMSVANLLVIALMIVVFVAAILLPFPHGASSRGGSPRGAHAAKADPNVTDEAPVERTEA